MEYYIIVTILAIIFIFIAYNLGKKADDSVATKQKIDNTLLLQERQSLIDRNAELKQNILSVEDEYNSKKEYIKSIEEEIALVRRNAEAAQQEKIKNLENEFQKIKARQDEEYSLTQIKINEDLAKLEHLKQTYARAVEANIREQQIKDHQDNYRLDISEQDESDIKVLSAIKYQISKPRIVDMLIWQTYYQPIAKRKFPLILGTQTVTGIYKITNINNNKCYIGQAVDIRSRWLEHCKCGLGIDTPQGNKLYYAMIHEGLNNFTFEVVEECAAELLNEKEKFYIDMYNACAFGYNSIKGVR